MRHEKGQNLSTQNYITDSILHFEIRQKVELQKRPVKILLNIRNALHFYCFFVLLWLKSFKCTSITKLSGGERSLDANFPFSGQENCVVMSAIT